MDFFNKHDIIYKHLFDFQGGKSTEHAVLDLCSRLCKGILLSKFEYYGVRGLPLKLMKFYFSDRTQCVKTGGGTSTHAPTTWSSTGNVWGHYFSLFVLIIYKNQTLKLLSIYLQTT